VGVFFQQQDGRYRNLGLALVEQPIEEADTFLLHGPVRGGQDVDLWSTDAEPSEFPEPAESWRDLVAMEELPGDGNRRQALRQITTRERQADFRKMLMVAYSGRCSVTGYDTEQALQAAHIFGYRGLPSHSPKNGLLLRADLHLLFDRHLLAVDTSEMRVLLSPSLLESKYSYLNGAPVSEPSEASLAPAVDRLDAHRAVFEVASSVSA
jgi:hypothetical protein